MSYLLARITRRGARVAFAGIMILAAVCSTSLAQAQDGPEWAPISGRPELGAKGIYGTQGVPDPENRPGVRAGAASWVDLSGNLWVFGGVNLDGRINNDDFPNEELSDLWKYDIVTGNWTWMKGSQETGAVPVPGEMGVGAPANNPAGRRQATTWVDESGKFWMFGGYVHPRRLLSINDLWMFDPVTNNWTWVDGPYNTANVEGVYGTQGVEAADNMPGARYGAVGWMDNDGNLWLFGGRSGSTIEVGHNDLWRYNRTTGDWTWMKGSEFEDGNAVFGDQGVADPANTPGALYGASGVADSTGRFWLYGGQNVGNSSYRDSVWMFDPATENWTWVAGFQFGGDPVYGIRGVADADNHPGSRRAAGAWIDPSDNFWIFGGIGAAGSGNSGFFSDTWKFDTDSTLWTWVAGAATTNTLTANQPGASGLKGEFSPDFSPGARSLASAFGSGSDTFYLFGGTGQDAGLGSGGLNDVWQFDVASGQWAWLDNTDKIMQHWVHGTKGVPAPENMPSAREASASWTDAEGNLWLFGGIGKTGRAGYNYLDGLWKFDTSISQWTWVNGNMAPGADPVFGTKGVSAPTNHPGARRGSISWIDSNGLLWLFGGQAPIASITEVGLRNDLWNFDPATGQWTWIGGPDTRDEAGVYGTMGTQDAANNPGARFYGMSWVGPNDTLWLFGGQGYDSADELGRLNDLWRYDPAANEWTWMRGADIRDQNTVGTMGEPGAPENTPRARNGGYTWTDDSGRFWLFAGVYGTSLINSMRDLWNYDHTTGNWTWVSGIAGNNIGVYGAMGEPSESNEPGSRHSGASWYASGKFWLFGGLGYGESISPGRLNDLWNYEIATGLWTWMGGSDEPFAQGVCGELGVSAPEYTPGSRARMPFWTTPDGAFWLMGGAGFDCSGYLTDQGDLWRYGLPIVKSGLSPSQWQLYR